ncbi:MAG: HAMP domain-containing sensor histidine kinase [Bacteroidales bacterium]|nr:HAMP domain-containing sensor histidine kinase [Bacteroidales bacterium]
MKIFKFKLKNKLVFFNALTKTTIVTLLLILVPWIAGIITRQDTDNELVQKLDKVLALIESDGINNFVDQNAELKSFGSYNIIKAEFVSIEQLDVDTLIDEIQFSQRNIEEEIIDYRVLSYSIKKDGKTYLIEIGKSMEDIYKFEQKLKSYAVIFLIIILFLTLIIDLIFIQFLLKPLDKITKKLHNIKDPVNFDYSNIDSQTTDFVYLDQSINALMQKIEKAFINEREYIGNVSHELLTPISIIRTKLDNIMLSKSLSETDMIKIVEAKQTLHRLTNLVRTLLVMSRIENEEYLLNEKVNINQLIDEVINEINDKILFKGLSLERNESKTVFHFTGNKQLLFTMIYNIINNSIRYTEAGSITIISKVSKDSFILNITDTGIGMIPNQTEQIFLRHKSFGQGIDNYGIGLTLTKKIADYHKITISVNSEHKIGTSIILSFPSTKSEKV